MLHWQINECVQCGTPTNNLIWCDQLCMRWNRLITREAFRRGLYPTQEAWDKFCIEYYGETKPMYEY